MYRVEGSDWAMKVDLDALYASGSPLPDARCAVPEPTVKALLASFGVSIPTGRTAASPADVVDAVRELRAPLVIKAWGRGLVHKSDVGAVRLHVDADAAVAVANEMNDVLLGQGITPAGFLVEEEHESGVELLIGVLNRPDVGPVVVLGLGGTLTEFLDQTIVRLCPLSASTARDMLDEPPFRALLGGARGRPSGDREALVAVLLAIAGPGGLVERLGHALLEFECNPVIVTARDSAAVDARLVLREQARDATIAAQRHPSVATFDRLFRPRSIGVIGASTSKVSFGNRFLWAYKRRGWQDGLYVIHPDADEVEGVRAYRSLEDVPGGAVDYLLVAVPAAACPPLIRSVASRVQFAQVVSGGFGEASADGRALEEELLRAGREAGVRVVGPNCMGVYSPAGRQTWQLRDPTEPGTVSVVSQSGGLAGDIIKAGEARGVRYAQVATIGNAVDVTAGELFEYFLKDPETEVIGAYLEGTRDGGRLLAALREARGRKPVVLLVGALSREGARAAASHTGSMTGDARVWEAVTEETGATVVRTLEELLSVLAFHQRYAQLEVPDSRAVLIIGPGGGASILGADACDRAGLALGPVAELGQSQLRELGYGAGTSVANPIEIGIGPAAAPDAFDRVIAPVLAGQSYPDVVLHVNVQSFYSMGDDGPAPLLSLLEHVGTQRWPVRVGVVLRNLDTAGADLVPIRERCDALGLPHFRTFDEAMVAVAAAKRFTHAAIDTPSSSQ